jgi:glycerol-3-phosphate dehydrogenase
MCQQTVEKALESFSLEERARFSRSETTQPLNEFTSIENFQQAQMLTQKWSLELGRSEADLKELAERFGREAELICQKYPARYSYWQLEAAQAIDSTMCLHLRDFFARRVHLFLADRNHGLKFSDEIGRVFQEKLGWTDSQLKEEMKMLTEYMADELEWKKHFK